MTLIAAWQEGNIPCLLGDLVVSRLGEFERPHYRLSTRDNLDDLLPREWNRRIVGTCQKVYRISDSFAVGWCDYKITAQLIIQDIMATYEGENPSLQEVREYFRGMSPGRTLPCLIVGWVVENGVPHCFRWRSDTPKDFHVRDSFIEGSGSDYFKEIFESTSLGGSNDPVNTALARIANLLGYEVLYGTNLWNLFGGGFQLIYLNNGAFTVLPSVTYVFLYAKEEEKNVLFGHERRVLKFHYENQVVQTLALLSNRDSLGSSEMHYALPIDAEPETIYTVKDNLSLVSDYYCIYVDVICRDGLHAEFVITVTDEKKDSLLRIIQGPGTIEGLGLSETLFRTVIEFLKQLDRDKSKYRSRQRLI